MSPRLQLEHPGAMPTFATLILILLRHLSLSSSSSSSSSPSSSSSFNFKAHETSQSIQIKAGTTRQETALTVALKININTSIKHQILDSSNENNLMVAEREKEKRTKKLN